MVARLSLLVVTILSLSCSEVSSPKGGDAGNSPDSSSPQDDGPCTRMDIMFVIDDSASMDEEQGNLATNFNEFANLLASYRNSENEEVDFRIAVTTTGRDVSYKIDPNPPIQIPGVPTLPIVDRNESGANGAFRQDCGLTRPWIESGDNNLSTTLPCLAQVGTSGPGIEMPFLTTRLALQDRINDGTNGDFLRQDALLGVVYLTDEDECSRLDNDFTIGAAYPECGSNPTLISPAQHVAFLDTVKQGRERWASAVIAGMTSCESALGEAAEAKRLKEFANIAGDNVTTSSICQGDLTTALKNALDQFQDSCEAFVPVE